MKKTLSEIKSALMGEYTDSEVVLGKYMDKVFDLFEDEFEVSEAFYFFNGDKRISINKNKQKRERVASENLHIATQFFTPKWLVQYVVDNSLGRFLKGVNLSFFHGDKAQIGEKEEIIIFDPAVGTGNMLVYAYELLDDFYRKRGFSKEKIPQKILSSFYGLDIDKRAVEVAKRLLMRKAGVDSFDFNFYYFELVTPDILQKVKTLKLKKLLNVFENWNKYREVGSLIKVGDIADELIILEKHIQTNEEKNIVEILKTLSKRYDVILMNPPYLSSSDFSPPLKEYIYKNYENYKSDLFACFIKIGCEKLKKNGFMGVVCPYNWMFIKTFSPLREYIIKNMGLYNLMQLNCGGYNKAVVYLSAFVVGNKKTSDGYYIRLTDFKAKNQQYMALKACSSPQDYTYKTNQDVFLKTPGYAIIYWTSDSFINNFRHKKLSDYLDIRQGMATGDNKRFLRKIENINSNYICFNANSLEDFDKSNKIYAPYNKGGKYRKWWGNRDYVIKFDKASREVLSCQGNRMPSKKFYFKECITWTLVSSKGHFGARYSNNSVFDVGGSCAFLKEGTKINIYVFLAFLCSKVATYYLNALNPTLNAQVGDIKNIPFIEPSIKIADEITKLAKENIEISCLDWYNKGKIGDFDKIKQNEQRINQIFIEMYSLQEELDCQPEDKLITLKGEKNEK